MSLASALSRLAWAMRQLLLQGAGVEGGQGLAGGDVLADGDVDGGDVAGDLE